MTDFRSPDTTNGVSGISPSFAAGPPTAVPEFDAVYSQYFAFVWRSLRLLGVPHELLEDAAQESFVVIARRLAEFSGDARLTTWIFSIVRRVAANQRRTYRRKQAPLQPIEFTMQCELPSPEANLQASQAAAQIQLFCARLSVERREVFVLALLEGCPAQEVASSLALPLNTVYSRIRLLREALRAFLDQTEVANVQVG